MLETIQRQWAAKVALVFFIVITLWWVYLKLAIGKDENLDQLFAAVYGIIAFWGAIWGFVISKKWGGFKSILGKAIALFSIGLFLQEFGQLVYSFYIYYLKISVPYPSLGDLGYFGSIPFYICGIIYLAQASGAKLKFRSFNHRLQAIIIPMIGLAIAYFLFLQGYEFDWTDPLKVFLDFGYPFGEAIYISLAIVTYLLSRGVLGGIMKNKVLFILFALVVQFVADYTFLYQSSRGIWSAGQANDYIYFVAYFIMTLALLQLGTTYNKLKS